ncbi:DUF930 domain-containing protein, partial [Rhizobium leguminosarum]|uniref:DUF930 domain-containing protein n=1 Tax=Rhizobium leguminosarum TaxID=384 RepID=UPI003F96F619
MHNSFTRWPGDILPNAARATGSSLALCENSVFTSGGNWYGIQFRCEVNADATKILSFAYKVGGLIP